MPTTLRRTWPQRLTLALVVLVAVACFATAAGLAASQWVLSDRQLVTLSEPVSEHDPGRGAPAIAAPGLTTTLPAAPTTVAGETPEPIELAEPAAANFLVVGVDNNECVPTGDRDDLGERSDTIMIWRANPQTNQLAVLSLPRDLYVDIAGGRRARINSAYRRDDPTRLIDTIHLNFGIRVDHYVQVDFCAFERLVDAVGGVEVPFEFPARDRNSGLAIPEAGCVELDGQMALAYVRSRKYQYEDPPGSGDWRTDGTSDFGRIARQQDFLRRVVAKVIDEGLYSPDVASALITTNREYLVTDVGLTARRMLEFANTLRNVDPAAIRTYRVESSSVTIAGEQVERPRIDGANMQAILQVFRGEAVLAGAPEQVLTEPRPSTTVAPVDGAGGSDEVGAPADEGVPATATTLPVVAADENSAGVAPDRTATCG